MQLYVVTWKFETSEYQTFARQALVEHVEGSNHNESCSGYERLVWTHTPQDGTGTVFVKLKVPRYFIRFLIHGERSMG